LINDAGNKLHKLATSPNKPSPNKPTKKVRTSFNNCDPGIETVKKIAKALSIGIDDLMKEK
jgi:hypothetical protein